MTYAFKATLFTAGAVNPWTFVAVPDEFGPARTEGWGRCPVTAEVEGREWKTSVWKEKSGRTLLPVPKKIRNGKTAGDVVSVRIRYAF